MVGDSYADDIEGARALGMRAILLDREGLYPGEPDRIADLAALPAALGLTSRASGRSDLGPPGGRVRAERGVLVARRRETELGRGLGSRRHGPDADVLAVEELEPLRERPRRERRLELARRARPARRRTAARRDRGGRSARRPARRTSARARRASGGGRRRSGRPGNTRAPR